MTAAVKTELCSVTVTRSAAQVAELSTLLRFTSEPSQTAIVEAVVDRAAVAARIRDELLAVFGYRCEIHTLRRDAGDQPGRHTVRVAGRRSDVARQCGLIDHRGHPVRGLPARVVGGSLDDATAMLRGAFLAHGHLSEPRRSHASITCPTMEAALAVSGAARRLGIATKTHTPDTHSGSSHQVVIRDPTTIAVLLIRIGAPQTAARFTDRRARGETKRLGGPLAHFDTANKYRSKQTAIITAARVRRAFDILGDNTPNHLAAIGQLRLDHPEATLDELGQLADPPMTKDTVSGRIRRLLATADTRATILGIPTTHAAITEELLEQL